MQVCKCRCLATDAYAGGRLYHLPSVWQTCLYLLRTSERALNLGMFGSRPSDQRSASPISTIGVLNPGNVQMPDRFTQNTVLMGKGAPHYQAQELHPQVKEHSCRSCEDGMEVDGGSPQCNISRSPAIFGSSERVSTENMQASGGLMRYHSAPSSMLSSLVDVGEDFLSQVSSPLSNTGDAEFAELFVDDLNTATTLCDKRALQQTHKPQMGSVMNGEQLLSEHRDRGRMITQQTIYKRPLINGKVDDVNRAPLSAIFEHGPDVPLGSFCNSQISGTCKQEASQTDHTVGMGSLVSEGNSCNPLVIPGTSFGSLPHTRGHLIRHSSSPAGLLSRLAMDVQGERCERPNPCFSGPMVLQPAECSPQSVSKERCFSSAGRGPGLVSGFSERNSFGANRASAEISDDLLTNDGHLGVPSPSSRSSLVRQSSSPAGLLSQLSLDGIVEGEEKVIMPSSSENHADEGSFDRRGGPAAFLDSYQVGSWDEQINAAGGVMLGMQYDTAFAARKRVRELEAKMFPGLTLPDSQLRDDSELGASLANQFCITPTTSPDNGLSTEKFPLDYVPLRARAKRGCATHPRSIAERVRRTKISERMRKLQDLVPNMDKQTNTADMLDEAVEYVKLLQRQVKELSENRPKCDGSCRQNKNDPHQV